MTETRQQAALNDKNRRNQKRPCLLRPRACRGICQMSASVFVEPLFSLVRTFESNDIADRLCRALRRHDEASLHHKSGYDRDGNTIINSRSCRLIPMSEGDGHRERATPRYAGRGLIRAKPACCFAQQAAHRLTRPVPRAEPVGTTSFIDLSSAMRVLQVVHLCHSDHVKF